MLVAIYYNDFTKRYYSMIDINDPKVRWAQQQADVRKEKMVIVRNIIGGLDVKPENSVNLFFPETVCVIEPKNHRFADRDPLLIARLKRGINLCAVFDI